MLGALQPEGCGFESTSRGYVWCLAAGGLRVRIHLKGVCLVPCSRRVAGSNPPQGGMFGALQPEGCGFESTSRGYVRCLAAGGLRVRIHLKGVCSVPCSRRVAGSNPPQGGMFGALQPEGCGFESTSSRRVGTLGKSFTRNCSCASA